MVSIRIHSENSRRHLRRRKVNSFSSPNNQKKINRQIQNRLTIMCLLRELFALNGFEFVVNSSFSFDSFFPRESFENIWFCFQLFSKSRQIDTRKGGSEYFFYRDGKNTGINVNFICIIVYLRCIECIYVSLRT